MPGQPAVNSNPFITFDVLNDITIHEVPGPNILGDPSTIIPETSGFSADVSFKLAGLFAGFVAGTGSPYTVTLRAESLGAGMEGELNAKSGVLVAGQTNYQVSIDVATGTLAPGIYKLAAVVTFTGSNHPPMYGFADGPVIEIYTP